MEEAKFTDEKINEDRRYQIEAKITKIMKEKKKMHHNELIEALTLQLNFPFEISFVK